MSRINGRHPGFTAINADARKICHGRPFFFPTTNVSPDAFTHSPTARSFGTDGCGTYTRNTCEVPPSTVNARGTSTNGAPVARSVAATPFALSLNCGVAPASTQAATPRPHLRRRRQGHLRPPPGARTHRHRRRRPPHRCDHPDAGHQRQPGTQPAPRPLPTRTRPHQRQDRRRLHEQRHRRRLASHRRTRHPPTSTHQPRRRPRRVRGQPRTSRRHHQHRAREPASTKTRPHPKGVAQQPAKPTEPLGQKTASPDQEGPADTGPRARATGLRPARTRPREDQCDQATPPSRSD
jgi:hypothetical protein